MNTPRLTAFLVFIAATSVRADIQLPSIISDHMVLQRSPSTRVWGSADPGEVVSVKLNTQIVKTTTDANGKWLVSLNLKDSGAGPFEVTVKGKNCITLTDVLVGEVWLGSGQSNMGLPLSDTKEAKQEIAASTNPQLRQFLVARTTPATPAQDCNGQWVLASPATSGRFSAVGYYFIKRLNLDLKVPVGLVNSSWGGTRVEAWMSSHAIESNPELAEAKKKFVQTFTEYPAKADAYEQNYTAWLKTTAREDHPTAPESYLAENSDLKDWVPIKLPGAVKGASLPALGAFWIRREVMVPEGVAGKPLRMGSYTIHGDESVYWNGQKLGETTPHTPSAEGPWTYDTGYTIPAALVKAGSNTLAVRIFAPAIPPLFAANPLKFKAGPLLLEGSWLAKAEFALPSLDATSASTFPIQPVKTTPSETPSTLFNGMIFPITSYSIRGVIWYQGEANLAHAWQYGTAFPQMIADWRAAWKQGDFPFYICQLANNGPKKTTQEESQWAEMREAQSKALKLPKTGQAVLIDIGESGNIHPQNKKEAGERLARIALVNDYDKTIAFSGPVYEGMKVEGAKIRLTFTHTEGGLAAKPLAATYDVDTRKNVTAPLVRNSPDSELEGFAVCGNDHKWVWANAKIEGGTIVVWSDGITAPKPAEPVPRA